MMQQQQQSRVFEAFRTRSTGSESQAISTRSAPQSRPFTGSHTSLRLHTALLTRMAFIPEATPYTSPARRAAYVYSFKSSFSKRSNK